MSAAAMAAAGSRQHNGPVTRISAPPARPHAVAVPCARGADAVPQPTGTGEPTARPPAASYRGLLWAALAVLTFSGWFATTRLTVTHTLRVWDVVALRFGIGGLLLAPVLFRPGRRLAPRAWREGALLSLLWGAPFVLAVALGLQWTTAAQASAVTPALMSVFAGLMSWRFLGQRPPGPARAGYLAIVAGVAVLVAVVAEDHRTDALRHAGGTAALVVAAALWAGYTVRLRASGLSGPQAAALVCVLSGVLVVPAYLVSGIGRLHLATARELAVQVVYQGVMMSVVATLAFNRAVGLLGPRAAAAIIALVPVVATAIAAVVLHEWPPLAGLAAIAFIAAGVVLAARPPPAAAAGPN